MRLSQPQYDARLAAERRSAAYSYDDARLGLEAYRLRLAPAPPDELTRVFRSNAHSLPGRFETAGDVLAMLQANVRFGRPDDYAATLKQRYEEVGLERLQGAVEQVLKPDRLTWVIIGDRAAIEPGLRKLGIGEVGFLDPDGNALH